MDILTVEFSHLKKIYKWTHAIISTAWMIIT